MQTAFQDMSRGGAVSQGDLWHVVLKAARRAAAFDEASLGEVKSCSGIRAVQLDVHLSRAGRAGVV